MHTNSWYICIHMSPLINDIFSFLNAEGFSCEHKLFHRVEGLLVRSLSGSHKNILVLQINSDCPEDAHIQALLAAECIGELRQKDNEYPLIISEDRWHTQGEMMKSRLLAHLEVFSPVYARNCEVRRIDRSLAKAFLDANHSYGYAACKYCYGMFLKRHTGHIAQQIESCGNTVEKTGYPAPGTLVAVATFSNARKWAKGEKTIRSYEWTRYASLPDVRLNGGMGRMLKTFIKEVQPDDIMSYADLEWSAGDVYAQLGFELEGVKSPVMFSVDTETWKRTPIKQEISSGEQTNASLKYFQNLGSNKYRLKLTDYK